MLGGAGLLLLTAGLGLRVTITKTASVYAIALRLPVGGIGFGLCQSPNTVMLMSSAPRERVDDAGGILTTARFLRPAMGAAAVEFCLSARPVQGLAAIWWGATFGSISLLRMLPSVRQR